MDLLSRDEFRHAFDSLTRGIEGIHDRLDAINGRTRTAEQKIAVLEDRSSGASSAIWGGGIGGFVVGLAEAVRWWVQK